MDDSEPAKSVGSMSISHPDFMSEVPPAQLGIRILHEEADAVVE
jgi:hypothetical protein